MTDADLNAEIAALRQLLEVTETVAMEQAAHLESTAEDLKRARDQAEAANTAKSAFLANMSHELRTPLNAIIGYSEIISEDAADAGLDAIVQDVTKIHQAGTHLLKLISELLDMSKIEAGAMQYLLEPTRIGAIVESVVNTAGALAEKNNNNLRVEWERPDGLIHTDGQRVEQILLNLVSNACKFCEDGVISVRICEDGDDGSLVRFDVEDSGIGMTPEAAHQVFQPFRQADSSTTRKYGGTGLGLAISAQFAKGLGGAIDVRSTLGVGSCFTLRLPVGDVSDHVLLEPQQADAPGAPDSLGRARVLVVDDDPFVHNLALRSLPSERFEVLIARDADEGLAMAAQHRPDAITLDVRMPGRSGWELLAQLKRDDALKTIPVIMMTNVDERSAANALGASHYISKPIRRQTLLRVLEQVRRVSLDNAVLLLERDDAVRLSVAEALAEAGLPVVQAQTGEQALTLLDSGEITAILFNPDLDDMDAAGFMERLRETAALASIPVVLMTDPKMSDEDQLMRVGTVDGVVSKDTSSIDALSVRIKAAIEAATTEKA